MPPTTKLPAESTYITAHDVFAVMAAAKQAGRLGVTHPPYDKQQLSDALKAAEAVFAKARRIGKVR